LILNPDRRTVKNCQVAKQSRSGVGPDDFVDRLRVFIALNMAVRLLFHRYESTSARMPDRIETRIIGCKTLHAGRKAATQQSGGKAAHLQSNVADELHRWRNLR
jgi:hypothetical protein